ncbi:stage IV sporulation protein FA [Lentibacillus kapialis]|uniref:Stage IV sporulation protein FA n=1 Tax=Lentibacillus kapialis TaxID=340214 RepID=A0A917PM83_9BACI|nr:M23 family metallopeptidase [Lentibacillus kapialis]GGJ84095.1 stage IV sporulation protein FA [Lentibacillus kapialis]
MDKGVKKVRKSIDQRKKMRGATSEKSTKQILPSSFPQEEEKHGYFPVFTDDNGPAKLGSERITRFAVKGILSTMLFLSAAFLMQSDSELLSTPKKWTTSTLTEEFPFASVNQWYQKTFGEPMALSSSQSSDAQEALALPVNGTVSETFQANGKGIKLAPGEKTDVSSLQRGVVTFAGNDHETGKTVIVQHADNSETVYGNLSSIDVHLYQFIDRGQKLGIFSPNTDNKNVYFAIEKNNSYVDPVQVIQVDDAE